MRRRGGLKSSLLGFEGGGLASLGRLGRVEGRAEVIGEVYDAVTLEAAHWCGVGGSVWFMGRVK